MPAMHGNAGMTRAFHVMPVGAGLPLELEAEPFQRAAASSHGGEDGILGEMDTDGPVKLRVARLETAVYQVANQRSQFVKGLGLCGHLRFVAGGHEPGAILLDVKAEFVHARSLTHHEWRGKALKLAVGGYLGMHRRKRGVPNRRKAGAKTWCHYFGLTPHLCSRNVNSRSTPAGGRFAGVSGHTADARHLASNLIGIERWQL